MLFHVVPLLLLASAVVAVPSGLGARIARRRANRQSQAIDRLQRDAGRILDEQYSSNWAGAIWTKDTMHSFNYVTGTFVVPTPSGNNGDSASAWVGIDGDVCTNGILQTGVDFTVSPDGPVYDAWYEFYPAYAGDFSPTDITIKPGDTIKLTVTASSPNSGTVEIENITRNQRVSMDLTSPPNSYLCGQNAEWIVEDYMEDQNLVPLANFGMVTFTDANAGTYTPADVGVVDIKQNGQVLTATSISEASVRIDYVGNH